MMTRNRGVEKDFEEDFEESRSVIGSIGRIFGPIPREKVFIYYL